MIREYIQNKRPAFFTRLSNLIILQFLFIFAAVGLLFLYPVEEKISSTDLIKLEERFVLIAEKVSDCYTKNKIEACAGILEKEFKKSFAGLDYISSNVYMADVDTKLNSIFKSEYQQKFAFDNFDRKFILSELIKADDHLIQSIPSTQKLVYYFTFDISPTQKALIAAEFDHHYFVTSRDKVLYIFGLLFLGGILITLLTIYLINKRIREPLSRIMKGLEKTTQGDLYYMVETNKDTELNKLTESFNKMSRTLWDNDQKLKKNNKHLVESNRNLLDSREYLRKILDNSTSSIITTDLNGVIQLFNDTADEQFILSAEKAGGSQIENLFTDDYDISSFDYESQQEVEVVCKKSDKTVFPAFVILAPIYDSENEISALLYVIRDISESKSIHNMMIKMDRYYTKGEMAGDIAHEINNFLAILSGNIELMPIILKKNDPEKIKSKLELMKKQVDRIVNFTDGLLEANDGDDSFVQVDMNQLIVAVKDFLQPQNLFDFIEIKTECADNIPLVHTNIGQVRQLFVNLIYNAGEELVDQDGDKSIRVITELIGDADNQTVTVTVKDNGPGVAKENVGYLFNKRFTTKPYGHGISLVACKKIVDTHFGSIVYKYENGASFTVVLPIKQDVEENNDTASHEINSLYA